MAQPIGQLAADKGVPLDGLLREMGVSTAPSPDTPVGEVLRQNNLSPQALQAAMQKLRTQAGATHGGVQTDAHAEIANTKDWRKIRLKFALWFLAFVIALVLLSRGTATPRVRIVFLAASVAVFGVWLGTEPNAPGTVKDALVLWGQQHIVFKPRMVAFLAFVLMGIIGNKVFCGWGCHLGALQDLASYLPTRKLKPPFWLSNSVRIVFTGAVTVCGALYALDIMETWDPFRVYSFRYAIPTASAVLVLALGLFVYRPWCTFLCPFGLVSWVGERIAVTRPRVNHSTCIDCRRCERACPTHSMEGLRAGRLLHQDCFACGKCLNVCPTASIRWGITPPRGRAEGGASPDE
jgi:polyferredoxin